MQFGSIKSLGDFIFYVNIPQSFLKLYFLRRKSYLSKEKACWWLWNFLPKYVETENSHM